MKNEFFTSILVILRLGGLSEPNCLEMLRHSLEALLTCFRTFSESFKAFDLGMTLTLKAKVKVTRPTRGLTVTTIIIGLWLIAIELQA